MASEEWIIRATLFQNVVYCWLFNTTIWHFICLQKCVAFRFKSCIILPFYPVRAICSHSGLFIYPWNEKLAQNTKLKWTVDGDFLLTLIYGWNVKRLPKVEWYLTGMVYAILPINRRVAYSTFVCCDEYFVLWLGMCSTNCL